MRHIPLLSLLVSLLLVPLSARADQSPPQTWNVKGERWMEYRTITNHLRPDAPRRARLHQEARWQVEEGQTVKKGDLLGTNASGEPIPAPFSGRVYTRLPGGRKGILLLSRPRFRLELPPGLTPLTGRFKSWDGDQKPLELRITSTSKGGYCVVLEGDDPRFLPFRPLTVMVPVARHRNSLVIQTAWIQWDRHQPYLWLLRDQTPTRQEIRYGNPVGERCPVLEGLQEGDQILLPGPEGDMQEALTAARNLETSAQPAPTPRKKRSRERKERPAMVRPKGEGSGLLRILGTIRPVLALHFDRQEPTPLAEALGPWITRLDAYARHYQLTPPPAHSAPGAQNSPALQVAGHLPLPGATRMEGWFGLDFRSFSTADRTQVQLDWPADGPSEHHLFESRQKISYTHLFMGLSYRLNRWLWAHGLLGMDMGKLRWDFSREAREDGLTHLSTQTTWRLKGKAPALTLGMHGRVPFRLGKTRLLTFVRLEYRWTGKRSWKGSGVRDNLPLEGTWCMDATTGDAEGALLSNAIAPVRTQAHAFRLGLGIGL